MKRLFLLALFIPFITGTGAQVAELKLTEFKELSGYEEYIMDAGFSPFGKYFALTVGNNRIEVYNDSWEKIWEHQGNPQSVGGKLVFSPDEEYLFFSKYRTNNDVAVLDLTRLEVIQVLTGHSDHIQALALSKNGRYLATACQDRLVRVWEWDGAQFVFLQEIDDHGQPVRDVVFSNDHTFLLSVGDSRKVVIKQLKGGSYKDFQVIVPGRTYIDEIAYHPLRDEFETTEDYEKRKQRLSAETLKQLQLFTEEALDIGYSSRTGMISAGVDEPLAYNADQEVYAIRAMKTGARVKIL